MILYIILALILWFVVPLFIEGHIRKKQIEKLGQCYLVLLL